MEEVGVEMAGVAKVAMRVEGAREVVREQRLISYCASSCTLYTDQDSSMIQKTPYNWVGYNSLKIEF